MVRQAKAYLAGAVSGTVLIAIAIAAFVLLVSLQVFRDWPLADLGGGDGAVAGAEALPADGSSADDATAAGAGQGGGSANEGGSGSGNGDGGADGTAGSPGSPTTGTAGGDGAGEGGGGGGSAGGGSTSADPPGGSGGSSESTGGKLTETVNDTVNQVDDTVLGGALGESGVTGVSEGVLDGVAGPESSAGKVVDRTTEAVGGLLGGGR